MARKSKGPGVPGPSGPEQSQSLVVRPQMESGEDTPRYYVNNIEVNSMLHDFVLTMGRVPGRLSREMIEKAKTTGVVSFSADLQVIIPPTLVVGLIRALSIQRDMYEKQHKITLINSSQGAPNE